MRVLFIGNFYEPTWDTSISDENHIHDALEELGHKVKRLQRGDTLPLTQGEPGAFDFILVSQWDGYSIEWLHTAKNYYMCPLVFWAYDFQEWGQQWCEDLVAEADLYLSKRIADSKYPNWQWLSQDFAPMFLDRHNPEGKKYEEREIDILFTGSYLPWATERNETIKSVDEKFNLVIHSVNEWPGLKDQRGPIMDQALPELYQNAKIVLAIDHTLEAGYWSDRSAQAMCCGSFVMQRYVPMMETHFPGMTFFYNVEDCLKKIGEYLGSDMGQAKMAYNSAMDYKYAQEFLKVNQRVRDLLTIVESIL